LVSTEEELRVNELLVDQLRGSGLWILYIRGVDRLGEKNKHKHFYLSTRVPFHCEITPSINLNKELAVVAANALVQSLPGRALPRGESKTGN
jgi:hypothetical protein